MLPLWGSQVVIYAAHDALSSFPVAQMLPGFEYSMLVSLSPMPCPIAEVPYLVLQETKLENWAAGECFV